MMYVLAATIFFFVIWALWDWVRRQRIRGPKDPEPSMPPVGSEVAHTSSMMSPGVEPVAPPEMAPTNIIVVYVSAAGEKAQ